MLRLLQQRWRRPESFDLDCFDIATGGSFDYLKLASRCTTENTFNRLHIELENICTPLELAEIVELAKTRRGFPRHGLRWLKRLRRLSPEAFEAPPRPYERRVLGRQIFLYGDPRFAPGGRGLLIGFTGGARRLLLPIPIILQFVDVATWDILLVSQVVGRSYLQGFEGISEDFPGLVAHIERLFGSEGYGRVVTFGTSAGGFFAVWAARLLGAERGISAVGILPSPLPPEVMQEKAPDRRPDLRFVYAREHQRDADSARAMQELYGGRLLPIPDVDTHAIFKILLRRNEFSAFMDEMLA